MEEEEREEQQRTSQAFHGTGFKLGDKVGPSLSVGTNNTQPTRPERVRV